MHCLQDGDDVEPRGFTFELEKQSELYKVGNFDVLKVIQDQSAQSIEDRIEEASSRFRKLNGRCLDFAAISGEFASILTNGR
jgi:hypothetical protein